MQITYTKLNFKTKRGNLIELSRFFAQKRLSLTNS